MVVGKKQVRLIYVCLSEAYLNKFGQEIVFSYNKDPFAAVDIEGLLKKLLNVSIEDYYLHPRGCILGMCSPHPHIVKVKNGDEIILAELNKNVVFIDSGLNAPQYEGRRNFTIAHEGSHHFLFRLDNRSRQSIHKLYRSVSKNGCFDPDEWKADVLASCLLLPEINVRNAFSLLFEKEHVNKITPFCYETYYPFSEMALHFHVSKMALALRLKKLKLIDEFSLSRSIDIIKTE